MYNSSAGAASAPPTRFPEKFQAKDLRFELLNPRIHRQDLLELAGDCVHILDGTAPSAKDLSERVTNAHTAARDATSGNPFFGAWLASYDTPGQGRLYIGCYCITLPNPSQIGETKLHAAIGDLFVRKGTGARSGLFQLLLGRAEGQADTFAAAAKKPRRLALLLGQGKETTATSLMGDHKFVLTAKRAQSVRFSNVTVLSKPYGIAL